MVYPDEGDSSGRKEINDRKLKSRNEHLFLIARREG